MDKFPKTCDLREVCGLRPWQDGAVGLGPGTHQRDPAEDKQLQKKREVFLTLWCWKNLRCTSKSMCKCPCPISPSGLPGSHLSFLLLHTSTLLLLRELSSSKASLDVHLCALTCVTVLQRTGGGGVSI